MGAPERELIDRRLASLTPEERRFRINAGQGWVASPEDTLHVSHPMTVRVNRGDVVLRHARVFRGAPVGWPDLFGWDCVRITPEMVGSTVAVAAGDEVKSGNLRLTRLQRLFRACLLRMGGRFRVIKEGELLPDRQPADRTISSGE
ncbi:MAG: hypothetical protein IMZ69_10380 [Spirochaetes bacterium]|nr:hypothetical protein [Spirochaetota bacterium]